MHMCRRLQFGHYFGISFVAIGLLCVYEKLCLTVLPNKEMFLIIHLLYI
jgi:hypothetical protein